MKFDKVLSLSHQFEVSKETAFEEIVFIFTHTIQLTSFTDSRIRTTSFFQVFVFMYLFMFNIFLLKSSRMLPTETRKLVLMPYQ